VLNILGGLSTVITDENCDRPDLHGQLFASGSLESVTAVTATLDHPDVRMVRTGGNSLQYPAGSC
jgi:hypothetical protein